MLSLCPLLREISRRQPVLTGSGFVSSIVRRISSSFSRQICGGARWSSLYSSFDDFSSPSVGKTDGGADSFFVNWIWGCFGQEMMSMYVASEGVGVLDDGWKYVFLFAFKVRVVEIDATVGKPCVVDPDGNYLTMLWDTDACIVADGEWKPGDPFLPPHIVTIDVGEVLGGQLYLSGLADEGGSHNGSAMAAVHGSGVDGAAGCMMTARVSFKAILVGFCLA